MAKAIKTTGKAGFDSYAVINDQDGLKAVVIKNAGKDAQSTLLY